METSHGHPGFPVYYANSENDSFQHLPPKPQRVFEVVARAKPGSQLPMYITEHQIALDAEAAIQLFRQRHQAGDVEIVDVTRSIEVFG